MEEDIKKVYKLLKDQQDISDELREEIKELRKTNDSIKIKNQILIRFAEEVAVNTHNIVTDVMGVK